MSKTKFVHVKGILILKKDILCFKITFQLKSVGISKMFKSKIMKIRRIKYGYDNNKKIDTVNRDCRNISKTKIQRVVLIDISIECMDKLHYDINAVIRTVETELLKYMGKSHVHFIII